MFLREAVEHGERLGEPLLEPECSRNLGEQDVAIDSGR
jgi:hypothetical protein